MRISLVWNFLQIPQIEYMTLMFQKEVTVQLQTKPSPEELQARQQLLSSLLKEPTEGRGAVIMIHLGSHRTLTRRFHGDDTIPPTMHGFLCVIPPGLWPGRPSPFPA